MTANIQIEENTKLNESHHVSCMHIFMLKSQGYFASPQTLSLSPCKETIKGIVEGRRKL